jgi:hypothetical protein
MFIVRAAAGGVFAATALFINNSVVFGKLGEVNGLAHSLTSLLRTVAPVFSGTVFSLSLSERSRRVGFPINYYLVFILFGLTILLCTALGAGLPPSINRQKADSDSINRSEDSSIRTEREASPGGKGTGSEASV